MNCIDHGNRREEYSVFLNRGISRDSYQEVNKTLKQRISRNSYQEAGRTLKPGRLQRMECTAGIFNRTGLPGSAVYLVLFLSLILQLTRANAQKQPIDYVDVFMGTSASRWALNPGPVYPMGMVKLAPDNQTTYPQIFPSGKQRRAWKAGYEYTIASISGFGFVHNYNMRGFSIMPTVGTKIVNIGEPDGPFPTSTYAYRSRIRKEEEHGSPGYYSVNLYDYQIGVELTSTQRVGIIRMVFPENDESHILFDLDMFSEVNNELLDGSVTKVSDTEIEGYLSLSSGKNKEYTLHFVSRFSKPFQSMDGWNEIGSWEGENIMEDLESVQYRNTLGGIINYETGANDTITVYTGLSYVSIPQARKNLQTEMAGCNWDFDVAHRQVRTIWNNLLNRIEVKGGTEENKKKFYTNLYRAYARGSAFSDVDGKYMDMCERVAQLRDPSLPVIGSDGFWATYWSLNIFWNCMTGVDG